MTFIQKLLKTILPRTMIEDIETESRSWEVKCSQCGYERSIWNTGGIRWKAKGKPKRLMHCPKCGKYHWHTVHKD